MNTHIEYDDFGEFIEVLDDAGPEYDHAGGQRAGGRHCLETGRESIARRVVRNLLVTSAAVTVIFSTTSFASALPASGPEAEAVYNPAAGTVHGSAAGITSGMAAGIASGPAMEITSGAAMGN